MDDRSAATLGVLGPAERALREVLHDRASGLPTPALLLDRLRGAMARTARRPMPMCAVLSLGLERPSREKGPDGGSPDGLDVAVGRALQEALRPGDSVAWMASGRFAVLLDGLGDPDEAALVARRLHDRASRAAGRSGREAAVSVGIAFPAAEHDGPHETLRAAELARTGGRREGAVRGAAEEAAERELRAALQRRELSLHYQPIVAIGDGRIVAFEALLRWTRADGRMLTAGEFIPTLGLGGIEGALGQRVLVEACRHGRGWQRRFGMQLSLEVAVNVSGRELAQPDFTTKVEAVLRETGFEPRSLALEVDERTLLADPASAAAALPRLRLRGVRIHVDGVAGGGASLGWLHRFRVDRLKLDADLLDERRGNLAAAKALMALAERFRTEVVAVRVETPAQLEAARSLGCRYAQGFLLTPPRDATAAAAALERSGKPEAP